MTFTQAGVNRIKTALLAISKGERVGFATMDGKESRIQPDECSLTQEATQCHGGLLEFKYSQ
jgi:hypothetical protein